MFFKNRVNNSKKSKQNSNPPRPNLWPPNSFQYTHIYLSEPGWYPEGGWDSYIRTWWICTIKCLMVLGAYSILYVWWIVSEPDGCHNYVSVLIKFVLFMFPFSIIRSLCTVICSFWGRLHTFNYFVYINTCIVSIIYIYTCICMYMYIYIIIY